MSLMQSRPEHPSGEVTNPNATPKVVFFFFFFKLRAIEEQADNTKMHINSCIKLFHLRLVYIKIH